MSDFSKEKREAKKLRKSNWKAYKKTKKAERKEAYRVERERIKEEYKDAPLLTRFFHVNGRRIANLAIRAAEIIAIGFILYLVVPPVFKFVVNLMVGIHIDNYENSEVDPEKLHALAPLDEEGAKRIAALPENDENDSWTFCVYMVGSNLEDHHENDLSVYVKSITAGIANNNAVESSKATKERIERFSDEIAANGLDVPEYMYDINKPVASSTAVTNDVIVTTSPGCASSDISEMCENILNPNITIVVQTGGATRWSNALVNPNKTQRFVIKNGLISEVESMHLKDSCNPDTLSDFISFCDDNYKSDHMAMILWDHGGGVTGYGHDTIFGSGMSLADLNTAFSKALKKDIQKPYFDFIGFDACLMAATDVAVALDGYGQYLVASEETEPGEGWDYSKWLKALSDNPSMNAAAVGQAIADSYMDFYMKNNADFILSNLGGNLVVTFSVSDMHKAALLDAAYEKMNGEFLKLVADNPSVLADMSRAATKTMRYAGSSYDYYNTIDLGTYLDYLSDIYPELCAEVRTLLKEAVLYTRSNSYLADSQGLSIYFPVSINDGTGLLLLTDYVYNISDKKNTNALYYYKVAGCLNDEMQSDVKLLTGKNLKNINTQMFYDYQSIIPEISNENEIVIHVSEELENAIQDVYLEFAAYDEDSETITYYGSDDCCAHDGEGNIIATVDGEWFAIDGSLLNADISFSTEETSTYVAKVLHNGVPSYMTFTLDHSTEDITINSVVKIPDKDELEYDAALRADTELNPGDTIVPILLQEASDGQNSNEIHGKKIKYKVSTNIELIDLPSGDYVQSVVVTDLRGDKYYSPVVEADFKNGKATDLRLSPEFVDSNN